MRIDKVHLPSVDRWAVLMYVPQRTLGPVRATTKGTDRYYFRVEDAFKSVPHDVLSAMFGATPGVTVSPVLAKGSSTSDWFVPAEHPRSIVVPVTMALACQGPGLAHHPYVSLFATMPGPRCGFTWEPVPGFHGSATFSMAAYLVGTHPLPPRALAPCAKVQLRFEPPFNRDMTLEMVSGADTGLPTLQTYETATVAAIGQAYALARSAAPGSVELFSRLFSPPPNS